MAAGEQASVKKRNHHFVWQHYLRAWEVDGGIACRGWGRIFPTSTKKIAVGRDFYRLKELTPTDLVLLEGLIGRCGPHVQEQNRWLVHVFTAVQRVKQLRAATEIPSAELDELLDLLEHNLEEDFHMRVEAGARGHLDQLRSGDLRLFDSAPEFAAFSYYLALQYMRTKKLRDRFGAGGLLSFGVDASAAWGLLRNIAATNISFSLSRRRPTLAVELLEAPQGDEFVTSDQPVVNLHALRKAPDEEVGGLTLYYPVSPERALVISLAGAPGVRTVGISAGDVTALNRALIELAHEQVFASNECVLRTLS